MKIREAKKNDIGQMKMVRNSTFRNTIFNSEYLKSSEDEEFIFKRAKGWVCEINSQIVGFSVLNLTGGNMWELFIHPEFEKKGIALKLNDIMLDWYFSQSED